ncbi:hypothetical protein B0T17DRAFT_483242 [Bombardia bombarda]|uniref:Uncharacterized protein n=1 Tax=Bombardia bombarda TaxID=252184 RepID=A0AA39XN95_9PEZI|nr:hypothetical protein B0T17DRAFT_483242 [Bombardia bombarda]
MLLGKGFQIWEIALRIGRSESVLQRTVQDNGVLASLLKRVKTGRWTSAEEDVLLRHLAKRAVPDKGMIAQQMGRTTNSVARQIRKLAKGRRSPMSLSAPVTSPDTELSKSEIATLEVRLDRILEGLTMADKTERWYRVLMEAPRVEWIERILSLIPTPVGRILAGTSPPTIAELRSLEWEHTSRLGVYAWILTRKILNPFYPEHYIYVGSATKYGKKGHFVALLSMEVESYEPNEIVKARHLIVLAEAALTIWLGALTEGKPDGQKERLLLRSLCPWDVGQISYCGICSHNPLSVDVFYPLCTARSY